jgi:hypothetical protein
MVGSEAFYLVALYGCPLVGVDVSQSDVDDVLGFEAFCKPLKSGDFAIVDPE